MPLGGLGTSPFGGLGDSYYDDPWDCWNSTATTATTAIWTTWSNCTATTTSTEATNSAIYRIWVTNTTTNAYVQSGNAGRQLVQPYRRTPEQEAEARRREEEYRERQKVEAERYRAAKERAEGLLYEHLTDEQRAEIKRSKFFIVQGGKTGRRYKINADGGLVANVHEVDDAGAVKRRLCAHLDHAANAPIFDHLLAQKLMLEYQEEAFLKVANDHGR